jgi:hypothetical protein
VPAERDDGGVVAEEEDETEEGLPLRSKPGVGSLSFSKWSGIEEG